MLLKAHPWHPICFVSCLSSLRFTRWFAEGATSGRSEIIFVVGVIATELVLPAPRQRFAGVELPLMLVDVAVFLGFTWVALRSERFWPLWIAAFQLTAIFGHVLKAIDIHLFSRAYAAALLVWAYPMLLVLAVGTWRGARRANRDSRELPT